MDGTGGVGAVVGVLRNVVDDDDKIAYRRVQVGILRQGRRVILDGIAANDRIVVTGLQRIRPGAKVIPKPAIGTDEDKQARDSATTSELSPDQPAIEPHSTIRP